MNLRFPKYSLCLFLLALLAPACNGAKLECGPGTSERDGECLRSDDACGDGTVLDDDGRCVIAEPTTCGPGTQRDANSGQCVVTDEVACGDNTAFDAASGTCLPTETVCADGTVYNAELGICAPSVRCRAGDIVLEGVCVPPLEALVAQAELHSVENDDPAFGGTANEFTLPDLDEKLVFAGTIDTPADLDGDGELDQDADVFEFQAEAGQWISLAVYGVDSPAVAYIVRGPAGTGYLRYSPVSGEADRSFVTTVAGTHTVSIVPQTALLFDDPAPVGSDDFRYVGTVAVLETPQPQMVNLASGVDGALGDPAENWFADPGFNPDSVGRLQLDRWADRSSAEVSFWRDGELLASRTITDAVSFPVLVPDTGQITFLVDAIRIDSPDVAYAISGSQGPGVEPLGSIAAGGSATSATGALEPFTDRFYSFDVQPGEVIELSHENEELALASLELFNAAGARVLDEGLEPRNGGFGNMWAYHPTPEGGSYLLMARAASVRSGFEVEVTSITPTSLGQVAAGRDETTVIAALTTNRSRFVTVSFAPGDIAEISQSNAGTARLTMRLYEDWRAVHTSFDLADRSGVSAPKFGYFFDQTESALFELHNETNGDITQLGVKFTGVTPTDLGTLSGGDSITESDAGSAPAGKRFFLRGIFDDDVILNGTVTASGDDVDFYLRDLTGEVVATSSSFGEESFVESISKGTYLFEVHAFDALAAGWELDVNIVSFPEVEEVEPNDDIPDASPGLVVDGAIRGDYDNTNTSPDLFELSIADGQSYDIGLLTFPDRSPNLRILNPNGEAVISGNLSSGDSVATFLEPGIYYVELVGNGFTSEQIDYILTVDALGTDADVIDTGGNDGVPTATMAAPVAGYAIEGLIKGSLDVDWYELDVPQATDLFVTIARPDRTPSNVMVEFRDDAMASLPWSNAVVSLPAGTSYMRVSDFSPGFANDYRVAFTEAPLVYASSPSIALPTGGWPNSTVTDTIDVPDSCVIDTVMFGVNIPHTFIGDIQLYVQSPAGTTAVLWDGRGGSTDDLVGIFPASLPPTDDLTVFAGEEAMGGWTVTAGDMSSFDTGTLEEWSVLLTCQ